MPNKTLYVRESDLSLWELAQAKLGQSISALFSEFLREKVREMIQTTNVFVHVFRSSNNNQDLAVTFAPVGPTGTGGSLRRHQVRESQLIAFLKGRGVTDSDAIKIFSQLENAQSFSELVAVRTEGNIMNNGVIDQYTLELEALSEHENATFPVRGIATNTDDKSSAESWLTLTQTRALLYYVYRNEEHVDNWMQQLKDHHYTDLIAQQRGTHIDRCVLNSSELLPFGFTRDELRPWRPETEV